MDAPRRLPPDDPALAEALALIRAEFAYMDGVIDPPSSIHRLTLDDLRIGPGEVSAIGAPVVACVVLTPKPPVLYLGKLAVRSERRGQGLARQLVDLASTRARELGLAAVELQVRVELVANHAAFAALGFAKTAETAHEGYDRPTSYTFRKDI